MRYSLSCFILFLKSGRTALLRASGSGHTDVVQLLISSGAQVDLQDMVRHNTNYSENLVNQDVLLGLDEL